MDYINVPWWTGRVVVLSDLHFVNHFFASADPIRAIGMRDTLKMADALILAGDLTNGPPLLWRDAFYYLADFISPRRTYVFPGNHDYYNGGLNDDLRLKQVAHKAGVTFVQKLGLLHGDTRFLCCTLWTDFALSGDPQAAMAAAQRAMRDYELIRNYEKTPPPTADDLASPYPPRITPNDTLDVHLDHRCWLDEALRADHPLGADGRTVVVTHHGPHRSVAGRIDLLTPSFTSNLSDLIDAHQPDAWFFGHSHRRLRAQVGRTDIRNVSIGYPGELDHEPLEYLQEAALWRSGKAPTQEGRP